MCKHCGYCEHCGRGGYDPRFTNPWQPQPWYVPTFPHTVSNSDSVKMQQFTTGQWSPAKE